MGFNADASHNWEGEVAMASEAISGCDGIFSSSDLRQPARIESVSYLVGQRHFRPHCGLSRWNERLVG
jgi:hypothetical protein